MPIPSRHTKLSHTKLRNTKLMDTKPITHVDNFT